MAVHQGSSAASTKHTLCRYYLHGVCREGENCQFSHDLKDKPSMVCKYYQQGSCSYGSSCRFDHVKLTSARTRIPSGPKPIPLLPRNKGDVEDESKMVTLTRHKSKGCVSLYQYPENWADAPVFVPGQAYQGLNKSVENVGSHDHQELDTALVSYSEAAQTGIEIVDVLTDEEASEMLCPFAAAMGDCPLSENCSYVHGLECEYCGNKCLHPNNPSQQKEHQTWCVEQHERDMEHSFAVQRSEGVTCGICLDVVKAKLDPTEQRFGILSNCNHAFCLSCIRHWRNTSHSANKIVRACPICRVPSAFVTPSDVWVDDSAEKQQLIEGYKDALRQKPCRYFAEGKGTCPFGTSCFYKHAYPDGRIEEVRLRHCNTAEGDTKVVKTYRLWDFLEAQEHERTAENDEYVLEEVTEDGEQE